MNYRYLTLQLGVLILATDLWAQSLEMATCRTLYLEPGETARAECVIDNMRAHEYTYQWESSDARYLGLLSSSSVRSPLISIPAGLKGPVEVRYLLHLLTPQGKPLGQASMLVKVGAASCSPQEGCADRIHNPVRRHPPQLDCPATVALYELEMGTVFCQATDPVTGTSASLRYRWLLPDKRLTMSAPNVPNPSVVAPPVPKGMGMLTFPLQLEATSTESMLTSHAEVTVVVEARDPYLNCPSDVTVQAGTSVVLDCRGVDPLGGGGDATYEWRGLWGTPEVLLDASNVVAPVFAAPRVAHDTTFQFVVHMESSARTAYHRVNVHVDGLLQVDHVSAFCEAITLYESENQPLRCRVPEGHHVRWLGPDTPHVKDGVIAAPQVRADTVLVYEMELCPDNGGSCVPGVPLEVRVLNQRPPACTYYHETYAGEPDLTFQCQDFSGSFHSYLWEGEDEDMERLSAVDVLNPVFDVPQQITEEERSYTYTLTVTDATTGDLIPTTVPPVRVLVRKRGQVTIACGGNLEYFIYVGSEDFPLDTGCTASGAPFQEDMGYSYRWRAKNDMADLSQLSDINVPNPIFRVPHTLLAGYTFEYELIAGARFADPGRVDVQVTVVPFPSIFNISVSTSALEFGVQVPSGTVTLDPANGNISAKERGAHSMGRMIIASDKEVNANLEIIGGMLRHESTSTMLSLRPQWSRSVSCLSPSTQVLASSYVEIAFSQQEGSCTVFNFGGRVDLQGAEPGSYAGSVDMVVHAKDTWETLSVPVFVTVVEPGGNVTASPQGIRLQSLEAPRVINRQTVSIQPRRAFLTSEQPYGSFTVTNPSLLTQEITVRPVFGYSEARTDNTGNRVVQAPSEAVSDLGSALILYPKVFTLGPGETKHVQYSMRQDVRLSARAFATQVEFSSRPRRYVQADVLPLPDDPERVAHLTLRLPGVYFPLQDVPAIAATLVSAPGSLLLETADGPFAGEVVATDSAGNELGRRFVLLLTRSIVQMPLDVREGEQVTLDFISQSGGTPQPVTLLWE